MMMMMMMGATTRSLICDGCIVETSTEKNEEREREREMSQGLGDMHNRRLSWWMRRTYAGVKSSISGRGCRTHSGLSRDWSDMISGYQRAELAGILAFGLAFWKR
jgi:hypothetical protein